MTKKIIGIIVARNTSSRFPEKHMVKLGNKTSLEFLIKRIKKIKIINKIVLSTTNNKEDDKLVKLATKNKIKFFRGDEKNVTKRVIDTAKYFKADIVFLITADCPVFDYILADQLIKTFMINDKVDYANNGEYGLPNGMGSQVFKLKSLIKSYKLIKWKDEYEHVTLSIRRRRKQFNHLYIHPDVKNYAPKLAVTLDHKKDAIVLNKIISFFKKKGKYYFLNKDIIENKKQLNSILSINKNLPRNDKFIKLFYK